MDTRRSHRWIVVAGMVLCMAAPAVGQSPTINGLFHGDGDDAIYYLLGQAADDRGELYVHIDGSIYSFAMVVGTNVNDNVFGLSKNNQPDKDYLLSAGWTRGAGRTATELIGSDHFAFRITCGATSWTWTNDYAYVVNDGTLGDPNDWASGPAGPDGGGTPPPGHVSATSFEYNMGHSTWDFTLGGTRTGSGEWKSPDVGVLNDITDDDYAGYYAAYDYEWKMVYEFQVDLSSCGDDAISVEVLTAHNSPAKTGDEDIIIPPEDSPLTDLGDAPDSYGTSLALSGPYHPIVPGNPKLGLIVDPEPDGTPSEAISDDVADGTDDEDGVVFLDPLTPGSTARIQVTGTAGALLDAWIDFNADGIFDATSERITLPAGTVLSGGADILTITVPEGTEPDAIAYARFRVSTAGGLAPTGAALDGEVEDYRVEFPTLALLSSFGASVEEGVVVVHWTTGDEIGSAGFWLERAVEGEGFVPVNEELIPAAGGLGLPGVYELADPGAPVDAASTWRLVELEVRGTKRLLGPFTVFPGDPIEPYEVWSRRCFGGPSDPDGDPDRDGFRNRGEHRAGTDPTDPASFFRLRARRCEDGGVALEWPAATGRRYVVENRRGDGFEPVTGAVSATPPRNRIVVPDGDGDAACFRVRID